MSEHETFDDAAMRHLAGFERIVAHESLAASLARFLDWVARVPRLGRRAMRRERIKARIAAAHRARWAR